MFENIFSSKQFLARIHIKNYKLLNLNFSNNSNKKHSKFTSNFVDDRDFSNFMRGTRQRGTGQRVLRYKLNEMHAQYFIYNSFQFFSCKRF